MTSGRLRHVVTLESLTETEDELGQPVQSWSAVGTFRAKVRDLQGKEADRAKQIKATLTHAVETRKLSVTVSPTVHRFLHRGRKLYVGSSIDVMGNQSQFIHYCESNPE